MFAFKTNLKKADHHEIYVTDNEIIDIKEVFQYLVLNKNNFSEILFKFASLDIQICQFSSPQTFHQLFDSCSFPLTWAT